MLDLSGPFTSPFGERRGRSLPPEVRRRNRRSVFLNVTLVHGDGGQTLGCTLRNCSDAGARVQVPRDTALSRELYLVHPRDGSAYWCRVVWRIGQRVGLKFVKKLDLRRPGPDSAEIDFLRKLWLEAQPRPFADCRQGVF